MEIPYHLKEASLACREKKIGEKRIIHIYWLVAMVMSDYYSST